MVVSAIPSCNGHHHLAVLKSYFHWSIGHDLNLLTLTEATECSILLFFFGGGDPFLF